MPSERLEAELVPWAARESAIKATFLAALAEFVRRRGWEPWECVSAGQWLSWKCGLGRVAASEHVRVATALGSLPKIHAALADGTLTWSKVRAMTRVATPQSEHTWLEVATAATAATAAQVERLAQTYRRASPADALRQERERSFSHQVADDDSVVITVRLPADVGMAVVNAVRAGTTPVAGQAFSTRAADAFVQLLFGESVVEPEVVIHADAAGFPRETRGDGHCAIVGGPAVPIEIAEQAACAGQVSVVQHGADGAVVGISRRRRFPSPLQRRALEARHRTCAMPGCHHEGRLQAHHLHHWIRGGPTKLSNVALVCTAHHRLVHLHHLQLTMSPDGCLAVADRHGRPLDRPIERLVLPYGDPVPSARPDRALGERLDLDLTLHCLFHPAPVR